MPKRFVCQHVSVHHYNESREKERHIQRSPNLEEVFLHTDFCARKLVRHQ